MARHAIASCRAILVAHRTGRFATQRSFIDRGNVTVVRRAPVHYRLENGLNVVLERDPAQPIVAVLVSYGAGSSCEPAGYRQLAHLTEGAAPHAGERRREPRTSADLHPDI